MQTKQLYHQLYCGPKLLWADFVWAEKVMGRFCHGPILLWAELSSDRNLASYVFQSGRGLQFVLIDMLNKYFIAKIAENTFILHW